MSKRKRFNPLEEKDLPSVDRGVFPPTPGIGPAQGGIGESQERVFQGQVERIERLRPSQMMPDRFHDHGL